MSRGGRLQAELDPDAQVIPSEICMSCSLPQLFCLLCELHSETESPQTVALMMWAAPGLIPTNVTIPREKENSFFTVDMGKVLLLDAYGSNCPGLGPLLGSLLE